MNGLKREHKGCLPLNKLSSDACEKLEGLLREFSRNPSRELGIEVIDTSLEAAKCYAARLIKDVKKSYANGLEQHMWRRFFYAPVETLKNSGGLSQALLLDFLNEAIPFYVELIHSYERAYGMGLTTTNSDTVLYWPGTGFPAADLCKVVSRKKLPAPSQPGDIAGVAIRSAHRHFLALGDLHRYRARVTRNERDIGAAKIWYLSAAQLSFSEGRCYNQAAIVTAASEYLDRLFFFTLAIAAKHPFSAARESLVMVMNEIREIVAAEEILRVQRMEKEKTEKDRLRAREKKADRIGHAHLTETWIHPKSIAKKVSITAEGDVDMSEEDLDGSAEANAANNEKCVLYLLHAIGTLTTKIGVEKLPSIFEQIANYLPVLVNSNASNMSALAYVELTLILTHLVHQCIEGTQPHVVDQRRDYALYVTLTFLSSLLVVLKSSITNLGLYIMVGKLSNKVERILPAVCLLANWMQLATVSDLLDNALAPAVISTNQKIYQLFADISIEMEANASIEPAGADIVLPEFLLASILHSIFAPTGATTVQKEIVSPGSESTSSESTAMQARLNLLKKGSRAISSRKMLGSEKELKTKIAISSSCTNPVFNSELEAAGPPNDENEDEDALRQRLIDAEHSDFKHEWLMEVCPRYLVPDTNTFVDHLRELKIILASKLYTLLVPITVVSELTSLSLGHLPLVRSTIDFTPNTQQKYVEAHAKETVEFLREEAAQRNPHLLTVTSNGNMIPRFSFACEATDYRDRKTNDDRILAACAALIERSPSQNTLPLDENKTLIKRSVVLLTEDRALAVKSMATRVPVKTVPAFMKWAQLTAVGKAKK